jgi:hypothetical protein
MTTKQRGSQYFGSVLKKLEKQFQTIRWIGASQTPHLNTSLTPVQLSYNLVGLLSLTGWDFIKLILETIGTLAFLWNT